MKCSNFTFAKKKNIYSKWGRDIIENNKIIGKRVVFGEESK